MMNSKSSVLDREFDNFHFSIIKYDGCITPFFMAKDIEKYIKDEMDEDFNLYFFLKYEEYKSKVMDYVYIHSFEKAYKLEIYAYKIFNDKMTTNSGESSHGDDRPQWKSIISYSYDKYKYADIGYDSDKVCSIIVLDTNFVLYLLEILNIDKDKIDRLKKWIIKEIIPEIN